MGCSLSQVGCSLVVPVSARLWVYLWNLTKVNFGDSASSLFQHQQGQSQPNSGMYSCKIAGDIELFLLTNNTEVREALPMKSLMRRCRYPTFHCSEYLFFDSVAQHPLVERAPKPVTRGICVQLRILLAYPKPDNAGDSRGKGSPRGHVMHFTSCWIEGWGGCIVAKIGGKTKIKRSC